MQQLEIEHKKSTNQKVVNSEEIGVVENMRERKGEHLSKSRNVFYLLGSNYVYYVQSERSDNTYYFVKYMCGVNEDWCSCLDSSMRKIKCKHIWSIEYSIRRSTLQEIEHLPTNAQRYPQKITVSKDWRNDSYDF